MAVSFSTTNQRTAEYRIYPEDLIVIPELNGRHKLPDIEWLIADFERRGQDTPVTIRKDGTKAVLAFGYSRWRAAIEYNKRHPNAKMQLRCTYKQLDEQEAYIANIAENRFRNLTTELDDAHNMKRLANRYNMTEEQIADVYFPAALTPEDKKKAVKWVRKTSALANLTPSAERAMRDGKLSSPAAHALAKLSADQQREAIQNSANGKVTGDDIRSAAGKPKPLNIKTTLKSVVESGKFQVNGKSFTADDHVIAFLSELLGIQAI